jgi:hypothetical protein
MAVKNAFKRASSQKAIQGKKRIQGLVLRGLQLLKTCQRQGILNSYCK